MGIALPRLKPLLLICIFCFWALPASADIIKIGTLEVEYWNPDPGAPYADIKEQYRVIILTNTTTNYNYVGGVNQGLNFPIGTTGLYWDFGNQGGKSYSYFSDIIPGHSVTSIPNILTAQGVFLFVGITPAVFSLQSGQTFTPSNISYGIGVGNEISLKNLAVGTYDVTIDGTLSGGAPVPEPSTMMLLGSGLVGLVGYGRRRFKK